MWYLCRVYVGDVEVEHWFPRIPVKDDFVDVGMDERKRVALVQLRSYSSRPSDGSMNGGPVAIVHTE